MAGGEELAALHRATSTRAKKTLGCSFKPNAGLSLLGRISGLFRWFSWVGSWVSLGAAVDPAAG